MDTPSSGPPSRAAHGFQFTVEDAERQHIEAHALFRKIGHKAGEIRAG
jgi:hypothetical protein